MITPARLPVCFAPRMANRKPPSEDLQVAVFRRDGWLCCWCKHPVIFAPVMKYLERELRDAGYDVVTSGTAATFPDAQTKILSGSKDFGIDSTPTIFINGVKLKDLSPEGLRAAIDKALSKPRS